MKTIAVIATMLSIIAFASVSEGVASNVGRHSTSIHKYSTCTGSVPVMRAKTAIAANTVRKKAVRAASADDNR